MNAGLIIGNIVLATFIILFLFKFNCTKVINYIYYDYYDYYLLFIITIIIIIIITIFTIY